MIIDYQYSAEIEEQINVIEDVGQGEEYVVHNPPTHREINANRSSIDLKDVFDVMTRTKYPNNEGLMVQNYNQTQRFIE